MARGSRKFFVALVTHVLKMWKNQSCSRERSIFCNFQNASPHNCSGHFPRNSTQLHYSRVLHTGRVSASVLNLTPLAMTCEHGPKIEISIMGYWWYFRCSWCLHVLKKIHPSVFVGSNQLYGDRRSFSQSFRKITFFFLTLLMAPTWASEHIACVWVIFSIFVVSTCAEENTAERVSEL